LQPETPTATAMSVLASKSGRVGLGKRLVLNLDVVLMSRPHRYVGSPADAGP
jgi:hypothetical protein